MAAALRFESGVISLEMNACAIIFIGSEGTGGMCTASDIFASISRWRMNWVMAHRGGEDRTKVAQSVLQVWRQIASDTPVSSI